MHLKLDETSGSTAADATGNGLTGTLNNMDDSDWVAGQIDGGLDFDGSNDFVRVNDNALLDFGAGDFSVSYWVLKQATSVNTFFDNTYGVSKWSSGASGGTNEWALQIGQAPSNGIETDIPGFIVEVGTSIFRVDSSDPLTVGVWHHVVGVRDGDTLRIYIDGVFKGTLTNATIGGAINNVGRNLNIAQNEAASLFASDAIFDDVRIYDHALTDGGVALQAAAGGEIGDLFDAGTAIPEPGQLALLGGGLIALAMRRRRGTATPSA